MPRTPHAAINGGTVTRMIRFDTFVASAVLLGAALVSAVAFSAVREIEHPRGELLQYIPKGKHLYRIEQNGVCVGTSSLSVDPSAGVTIIFRGTVQTKLQQRTPIIEIFVGAFFNSLEQLVRANIDLSMEGRKIHIALLNPNPITAEITATNGTTENTRSLEFPGPIYLRANDSESYRVDYQATTAIIPSGFPRPSFHALGWTDVRLVPAEGAAAECGGQGGQVSLDELFNFLTSQVSMMKMWVGPMVNGL